MDEAWRGRTTTAHQRIYDGGSGTFLWAPGWPRRMQQRTLPLKAHKKKDPPVAAPAQQHRRESERDRARGLVAHPSRTWDLDWTWVHASGHGEIRVRCPIIAIAQRLTHPPRFAPPGKRHRHFGPFRHDRPEPFFHPVPNPTSRSPHSPEREKGREKARRGPHVRTYVRAGAARHLGLCRPLVARAGATTESSDRSVRR